MPFSSSNAPYPGNEPLPSGNAFSVLVVEDQGSVRAALVAELRRAGVSDIFEAPEGQAALHLFKTHRPDLVLLDIKLPGQDGYWVAQQMRESEAGDWTPIIFLSGLDNELDVWRGIEVGGDDYLVKPVKPIVLMAKLRAMRRLLDMRRRLVTVSAELHLANKSHIAATPLALIGQLYGIERELKDAPPATRLEQRQAQAAPVAARLHEWLVLHRIKVPDGTAIAKAIDYSLNRWVALTRYLADPALPIDNNHDEQQIRPWATGRKNWLFAGTQLAGQRAAAVMSLIQSAKLNGLDPYEYLRDVLTRLPTQKASRISELLPHRWASVRAG